MSLIDAATIAALTVIDESAMIDSFIIATVTKVSDGAGSYTETTSTQTVPGYFVPARGTEQGGDQLRAQATQRIALRNTAIVTAKDHITHVASGRVFDVVYVPVIEGYSTDLLVDVKDH